MKRRREFGLLILIVGVLIGTCGVWLHVQRQQYAHNRALIAALTHEDTKQALALVNAGADPNTRYDPPPAPTFQLLLDHFLHRSPPTNNSPTALMLACGDGFLAGDSVINMKQPVSEDVPLLRAMLAHGANVRAMGWRGLTAFHHATLDKRLHTVELLLQHGANINMEDAEGNTPLILAIMFNSVDSVRLLLSYGANPNVQNVGGDTPLHYAVMNDAGKSVIYDLLAHGAAPNLVNKYGVTPFQIAQASGRPDLMRLLKRH